MNSQQPPYNQGGAYYGYQGPPQPGQPPYPGQQQQPPPPQGGGYYNYGQQQQPPPPQQGQYPAQPPPPGQYPNQQYGGAPPPGQQPPYGGQQYGAPPPGAPYGQQPPPAGYPGAQQPPHGQQPPYGQQPGYPPQQYGAVGQPPPQQQWQQPPPGQPYGYQVQPTPASPGYDAAQKQWAQPVDTASDCETLRSAMKGFGCNEKALIDVLTNVKYSNPWAMQQLVRGYNSRFMRDLAKDIESETRGDFETGLLALIRGPLENDARVLAKALNRAGTDEEALNDVLLCRSNADIRAIAAEYRRIQSRELIADIKDDVGDTMGRLYSMILAANRAEDAAPVNPAEIDQKVTELQRATEGMIGANAVSVAQILTSSNDAQIHAMVQAYQRKYHRSLQEVIEKEFRGDMEDALLFMVVTAVDRTKADAQRLRAPLLKTVRPDHLFVNRVLKMYLDRSRLEAARLAYKKMYGVAFSKDVKDYLSGDYEKLIVAMIGGSKH